MRPYKRSRLKSRRSIRSSKLKQQTNQGPVDHIWSLVNHLESKRPKTRSSKLKPWSRQNKDHQTITGQPRAIQTTLTKSIVNLKQTAGENLNEMFKFKENLNPLQTRVSYITHSVPKSRAPKWLPIGYRHTLHLVNFPKLLAE